MSRLLTLATLVLAACHAAPASAPASPVPSSSPAATVPAASRWPGPCPAIDGVDPLVAPGSTLLLGELHGTEESPRFVGDVACHASAAAPVTIAVEIARDEQPRIDAFLAAPGDDAAATAALLAGRFWRRELQDGRSSQAMASLLARARAARGAGVDVAVLAFDVIDPTPRRDQEMAAAIAAARRAAPARTFVVLAGNYHTRTSMGAPWDPAAKWMAWYLVERGITLTTLDVARAGGSAWVCMGADPAHQTCGAQNFTGTPGDVAWRAARVAGVEGHDGHYLVGLTHASPPAVTVAAP